VSPNKNYHRGLDTKKGSSARFRYPRSPKFEQKGIVWDKRKKETMEQTIFEYMNNENENLFERKKLTKAYRFSSYKIG
jgi:hypothetical protein